MPPPLPTPEAQTPPPPEPATTPAPAPAPTQPTAADSVALKHAAPPHASPSSSPPAAKEPAQTAREEPSSAMSKPDADVEMTDADPVATATSTTTSSTTTAAAAAAVNASSAPPATEAGSAEPDRDGDKPSAISPPPAPQQTRPRLPSYAPPSARPYSATFEDELMSLLLHGTQPAQPMTMDEKEAERKLDATGAANGDDSTAAQPVPLGSDTRRFDTNSKILSKLGIKLTHEKGSLLGGVGAGAAFVAPARDGKTNGVGGKDAGTAAKLTEDAMDGVEQGPSSPGPRSKSTTATAAQASPPPDPAQHAFVLQFLQERDIKTVEQLERAVEEEIEKKLEEAKDAYRRREEASRCNERVKEQIREMEEQRAVERRVWERMSKGGAGVV